MVSVGLYLVTLAVGGAMLAWLFRARDAAPTWLAHYRNYLLFFYAGTLVGQVIPIVIGQVAAPPARVARGVFWLLQATVVFPVSLLALYSFGRFAADLSRRAVSRRWAASYFPAAAVAVMAFLVWTASMLTGATTFWPRWLYEAGMTAGAVAVSALVVWASVAVTPVTDAEHRAFVRQFAALFVGGLLVKWVVVTFGHVEERWHDLLRTLLNVPSFALLAWHATRDRAAVAAAASAVPAALGDDLLAERLGVTKREAEVARLVCEGRTNREIGEQLFIAPQTVKQHLYAVYRKLGIENRVQLVNTVHRVADEAATAAQSSSRTSLPGASAAPASPPR